MSTKLPNYMKNIHYGPLMCTNNIFSYKIPNIPDKDIPKKVEFFTSIPLKETEFINIRRVKKSEDNLRYTYDPDNKEQFIIIPNNYKYEHFYDCNT